MNMDPVSILTLTVALITAGFAWRGIFLQKKEQRIHQVDRDKAPKLIIEFTINDELHSDMKVVFDGNHHNYMEQNLTFAMRNVGAYILHEFLSVNRPRKSSLMIRQVY
jgi:hypothetical protein